MDFRGIFMGVIFSLIWSSAFTSATVVVTSAPPLLSLSLRFFLAGIIGVSIAMLLGQTTRLTQTQWRVTFIFGICQNTLYLGLNFLALQTVEASLASIIASSMPLMVALSGWMIFGEKLSFLTFVGLFLGFFGVAMIMGLRVTVGADSYGIILCIIGSIAFTAATLTVPKTNFNGNMLMVVSLQMFVGAFLVGIAGFFTEEIVIKLSWQLTVAFFYTTLFPGLGATFIWFLMVKRMGAVKASTFHFLNPFFGVLIATLILGEATSIMDFLGVVVITVGILMVQLSKREILA